MGHGVEHAIAALPSTRQQMHSRVLTQGETPNALILRVVSQYHGFEAR